ncbi:MAG: hypothetical protein E6H57_16525 [Betaproteobacteria bacterium]|nr:MAG: hypothetical protein E6H57_16525 [Betaproteobacteria bacterium]
MNTATLQRRQPAELGAFALAIALLAGCASTRPGAEFVAPQLIAPGRVAIVAARYVPEPAFNTHARGRGAAAGENGIKTAAKGALAGAVLLPVVVASVVPPLIALAPLLAPIGAVTGAVVGGTAGVVSGAWNGLPSEQVAALHQPIERARREQAMQSAMAKRVLQEGAAMPHYQFAYLPEAGPASAADTPDYHSLKAEGFDSVLELGVASVGFEAMKGEPASAVFEMKLRTRVVPLSGHGSPLVRDLQHRGQWRGVPQWVADDGRLFDEELTAAYSALAGQLSQAAFRPVSAD